VVNVLEELKRLYGELQDNEKQYKDKKAEIKNNLSRLVTSYKKSITQEFIDFYYWETNLPVDNLSKALDITAANIKKRVTPKEVKYVCLKCHGANGDIVKLAKCREDMHSGKIELICDSCKEEAKQKKLETTLKRNSAKITEYQNMTYGAYLLTPHWRRLRMKVIRNVNGKCQNCGTSPYYSSSLHVHHLTYEHRGYETFDELMVLCKSCHEDLHGRKFTKGGKPTIHEILK
jgi:5-methylcytosine-specific restriction endonuclease McrA